jgi:hypothetical protein
MSTESTSVATTQTTPTRWAVWLDQWSQRLSEYCNPILVKETRQALKSRQFVYSFLLMLIACLVWSFIILGLTNLGNNTRQIDGRTVVVGYVVILTVPLLLIVPFGAYRSLVLESEDKTHELLQVTTLGPWQIVLGKYASSMLQMMLYICGVLPCLAFSVLLPQVDINLIGLILFYLVMATIAFSAVSLALASLTHERFAQLLMMVALLGGLFLATGTAFGIESDLLYRSYFTRFMAEPLFVAIHWGFLLGVATSCLLCFAITASRLTFESDNRSSLIRVCAVLQQAVYLGWVAWMCYESNRNDPYIFDEALIFAGLIPSYLYWYVIGCFTVSEPEQLSPRVQRQLPKSQGMKLLTSGYFPGPGRGYWFILGNVIAVSLLVLIITFWFNQSSNFNPRSARGMMSAMVRTFVLYFPWYAVCYIALYLGVGSLLIRALQHKRSISIFLRVLIHALIFCLCLLLSVVYELVLNNSSFNSMQLWHTIFNPFYTMAQMSRSQSSNELLPQLIFLLIVTGIVVGINLLYLIRELRQLRIAIPERILAEIQAQEATERQVRLAAQAANPWDD